MSMAPTRCRTSLIRCRFRYRTRPSRTSTVARGFMKFPVPIATADAPASRNSTASSPQVTPPTPTMGMGTALETSHTMRTAIGRIAGPDSPPVHEASFGRRVSTSMAMPTTVLISDTAVAPPAWAALAVSAMSVTFGDSFTMVGKWVDPRTARVTSNTAAGDWPKLIPPCLTLGHDTFTSIAWTPSSEERRRASRSNSSTVPPKMLTVTFTSKRRRNGSLRETKASRPTLASPIALSIPDGVSINRGSGFPVRGSRESPFTTIAPSRLRSSTPAYSSPYPNVPDAATTGVFKTRPPPRSTASLGNSLLIPDSGRRGSYPSPACDIHPKPDDAPCGAPRPGTQREPPAEPEQGANHERAERLAPPPVDAESTGPQREVWSETE